MPDASCRSLYCHHRFAELSQRRLTGRLLGAQPRLCRSGGHVLIVARWCATTGTISGSKATTLVRASIGAWPVRRLELAPPPWLQGNSLRRADRRRSSRRPRPEPSSDQLDQLRVKEGGLLVDPCGRGDLLGTDEQVFHVADLLVVLDRQPPSRLLSGRLCWSSSASRATPLPACPLADNTVPVYSAKRTG